MNREELVEKIKEVLSRYSEEKKPGAKAVIVTIPDTAEFTGDLTAIQLRDIVFRRMMEEDRPCNVISGSGEGEVLTFGIVKKMKDEGYFDNFVELACKFKNIVDLKIVDVLIIF